MLPLRALGRVLVLALGTAFLVIPVVAGPPAVQANPSDTGVVITTLRLDDAETPAYVELYNPTDSIVIIGGWSLQLRHDGGVDPTTGDPSPDVFATHLLRGAIPPHSHYLIEGVISEGERPLPIVPDDTADPDSGFAPFVLPGVLVLADTTDTVPTTGNLAGQAHVVDAVGWGASTPFPSIPPRNAPGWEGSGPANPSFFTVGLTRSGCAVDTDDNPADFTHTEDPELHTIFMGEPACMPPCHGQTPTVAGQGSIAGTPGPDVILGSAGDDVIDGGGGDDTICGLGGDDIIGAGAGADTVLGGPGNDTITAATGQDDLRGGAGDDVMTAGISSADVLGDTLIGGKGDDVANGGPGADAISGGVGSDTLQGRGGTDTLVGGADADDLTGGAEGDILVGSTGNDDLAGGAGDDDLSGRGGDDSLRGGDGDDTLRGGTGTDFLDGGSGTNVLVP